MSSLLKIHKFCTIGSGHWSIVSEQKVCIDFFEPTMNTNQRRLIRCAEERELCNNFQSHMHRDKMGKWNVVFNRWWGEVYLWYFVLECHHCTGTMRPFIWFIYSTGFLRIKWRMMNVLIFVGFGILHLWLLYECLDAYAMHMLIAAAGITSWIIVLGKEFTWT